MLLGVKSSRSYKDGAADKTSYTEIAKKIEIQSLLGSQSTRRDGAV